MKYTKDMDANDRQKLESLISQGVPDVQISKKLKIAWSVVQKASTRYWKRKMEEKKEENEG